MDKTQEADPAGSQVVHHVDPVLEPENQHHHAHQHHTAFAEEGRQDEVVYSKDAGFEKGIVPEQTPLGHGSKNSTDEEAGENFPAHLVSPRGKTMETYGPCCGLASVYRVSEL